MTPALEALARRAVACRRWRWMPGMLRLRDAPGKADHLRRERRIERADDWFYSDWPCLPDLADHATLGCFLALVREAWGDPWLAVQGKYGGDGSIWYVCAGIPHGRGFVTQVVLKRYDSEPEALVAALERAP